MDEENKQPVRPNDFLKGTIFDPDNPKNQEILKNLPDKIEVQPPEKKKPTVQEFWKLSEIPTRFRRSDLEMRGVWNEKLNMMIPKLRSEPGFILAIRGPRGTGKTQLAVELLRHASTVLGLKTRFTSARDIQLATTSSFKSQDVTDLQILQALISVDVLLVDEFDWQPLDKTHYFNTNLFYILDKRYAWCRSTILTSNATIEQFQQQTDPGILSRMNESGGRIDCDDWQDQRKLRRIR